MSSFSIIEKGIKSEEKGCQLKKTGTLQITRKSILDHRVHNSVVCLYKI